MDKWTPSGVRLRLRHSRAGDIDWLLLPGGPGIGSESLCGLADCIDVPGRVWLVDLPGDGSNTSAPGAPAVPFDVWPAALLEAAAAVSRPVFVGHSTGGMYLLSVPELDGVLAGLVLVSTAPDASWLPVFTEMADSQPLPEVDTATAAYNANPTNERLKDVAVASAPWNFGLAAVHHGRDLLARMPYNREAVEWSAQNFDTDYAATWWPRELPTLIVSGSDDRIVTQALWDDVRFGGSCVSRVTIDGGAHFPWVEEPEQVRSAFSSFAGQVG